MTDFKLGKLPAVHDPRTLALANYTAKVPAPPAEVHRSHNDFAWGMLGNDKLGCCTISGAGHLIDEWALETKRTPPTITDQEIIRAYSAVSGYDPTTGTGDNGAVELDVLKFWRSNGIAGDKIAAFASVNPRSATQIKQAVYLFGGCYLGLALPVTAQAQTGVGKVWDTPSSGLTGNGAPGSWGGHAVPIVSYDAQRVAVITWGFVQLVTWRFLGAYLDESWCVLSQDMLTGGKSPQGLNVTQLQSDLAAI